MAAKKREASNGSIGCTFGLIVGALVGAAMAMLMAPQPGQITREQLRRKLRPS